MMTSVVLASAEKLGTAGTVAVGIVIVVTGWWIALRVRDARQRRRALAVAPGDRGRRRDYRAFLRAIREQPGNGWVAASAVFFAGALASETGAGYAVIVVAGTLLGMATLGFVAWRWWGP
jgi:hypothetical protein